MTRTRRCIAASVCAIGAVADIGLGVAILRGAAAWVMLLHPLAIGVWVWGSRRTPPYSPPAQTRFPREEGEADVPGAPPRGGRALVIGLVALALFPGFGITGWAAGMAAARLPLARRARLAPRLLQGEDTSPVAALPDAPEAPWVAVGVQPLVDVLREPDPALRRAAIRVLGAEPTRAAVRLLQALLVDPDPDVRSEASATLFRFENRLNRALAAAVAAASAEPEDAERHAAAAAAYRRYVASDLLDPASARLYRARAADALTEATARAPERADLWLALARVQHERGESVAASAALDRAMARGAGGAETALLRMEIAFRAQAWEVLTSHDDGDDAHALRRWWREGAVAEPVAVAPAAQEG